MDPALLVRSVVVDLADPRVRLCSLGDAWVNGERATSNMHGLILLLEPSRIERDGERGYVTVYSVAAFLKPDAAGTEEQLRAHLGRRLAH